MTIYEKVAELHNTTPEKVERDMRQALEAANITMEPEEFVVAIAKQIVK